MQQRGSLQFLHFDIQSCSEQPKHHEPNDSWFIRGIRVYQKEDNQELSALLQQEEQYGGDTLRGLIQ